MFLHAATSAAAFLLLVATAALAQQQGPPQQQQQQQQQAPAPPAKCDLPFGNDAFLSNETSPTRVTVTVKQMAAPITGEGLKKLRGTPLLVTVEYTSKPGAKPIGGTAIRPGLPWPVGEWDKSLLTSVSPAQAEILDCLHPKSLDTLLITGPVPNRVQWRLTPFLAAWNNQATANVTFEVGFANSEGEIWIQLVPVVVAIGERNYNVPRELLPPPPVTPEQQQQRLQQLQAQQQQQQQQQRQQPFGNQQQ